MNGAGFFKSRNPLTVAIQPGLRFTGVARYFYRRSKNVKGNCVDDKIAASAQC
jgi:hypothetical protein